MHLLDPLTTYLFFAGLVRENDRAQDELVKNDGFSVILRAMQTNVEKLRVKGSFLITSLMISSPKFKGGLKLSHIYCRFTKDCVELILRIYRKLIFAFFNFANWLQHGVPAFHLKWQRYSLPILILRPRLNAEKHKN